MYTSLRRKYNFYGMSVFFSFFTDDLTPSTEVKDVKRYLRNGSVNQAKYHCQKCSFETERYGTSFKFRPVSLLDNLLAQQLISSPSSSDGFFFCLCYFHELLQFDNSLCFQHYLFIVVQGASPGCELYSSSSLSLVSVNLLLSMI